MRKAIIMGAGGRDFHNFNVFFRNNTEYKVVVFTAAQIPFIENRAYPSHLAGESYPNGIPIYPEKELKRLIKEQEVDDVFLSYSDVPYEYLMHIASIVLANGAFFHLLGAKDTMLKSRKFVISVVAVRTEANLVDPKPHAIGSYKKVFNRYQIGKVLHALGYSKTQLEELEHIVNAIDCDAVVLGTPADLTRLIRIDKPVTKVRIEAVDVDKPDLEDTLMEKMKNLLHQRNYQR